MTCANAFPDQQFSQSACIKAANENGKAYVSSERVLGTPEFIVFSPGRPDTIHTDMIPHPENARRASRACQAGFI